MIVKVQSETVPTRQYTVDTEKGTCNCPAGGMQRKCKHLDMAATIAQSAEQDGNPMTQPEAATGAANIHTAILAVMGEVGYVQKTGQMEGRVRYRFAGEADFIHAIRPAMVQHGVYCYPAKVSHLDSETYTTTNGATMNLEKVTTVFRFVHAPSGTGIDVEVVGAGADSGDKAIPKANTGALKYALRQTFLIETGDDPDDGPSDQQERASLRNRLEAPTPPPPSDAALMGRRLREEGITLSLLSEVMQRPLTRENFFEAIKDYCDHTANTTLETLIARAKELQS